MYFYRYSLNLEHIDHCGWLRQLILIAVSVALTVSFNVHIDKVCNYLRKNYNYICAHILNLSGPSKAHSKFFISFAVILMFVNCFCLHFSLSLSASFSFSLASIAVLVHTNTGKHNSKLFMVCRLLHKQLVFLILTAINQQIFSICNYQ